MKKVVFFHCYSFNLQATTQKAVARIKKDYKGNIVAYDKTRAELMEMSDMLAIGIMKQLPGSFVQ